MVDEVLEVEAATGPEPTSAEPESSRPPHEASDDTELANIIAEARGEDPDEDDEESEDDEEDEDEDEDEEEEAGVTDQSQASEESSPPESTTEAENEPVMAQFEPFVVPEWVEKPLENVLEEFEFESERKLATMLHEVGNLIKASLPVIENTRPVIEMVMQQKAHQVMNVMIETAESLNAEFPGLNVTPRLVGEVMGEDPDWIVAQFGDITAEGASLAYKRKHIRQIEQLRKAAPPRSESRKKAPQLQRKSAVAGESSGSGKPRTDVGELAMLIERERRKADAG